MCACVCGTESSGVVEEVLRAWAEPGAARRLARVSMTTGRLWARTRTGSSQDSEWDSGFVGFALARRPRSGPGPGVRLVSAALPPSRCGSCWFGQVGTGFGAVVGLGTSSVREQMFLSPDVASGSFTGSQPRSLHNLLGQTGPPVLVPFICVQKRFWYRPWWAESRARTAPRDGAQARTRRPRIQSESSLAQFDQRWALQMVLGIVTVKHCCSE